MDPDRASSPPVDGPIQDELFEVAQYRWQGALPHPNDLRGYESVLPGAADRIIGMTERSLDAQSGSLEKTVGARISQAKIGQVLAFVLTILAFVCSVVFFGVGNNWAGGAFLAAPTLMLIREFLPTRGKADASGDA